MGAEFIISSLYQRDDVENKELNLSGVKGSCGGASAAMTRPLSPSSGGKMRKQKIQQSASYDFNSILMAYLLPVTCSTSGPCGVDR